MPLKTSFFPSLTDEPICQPNRVSIKTLHVKLFFDKKTCVCQKLSWGGRGLLANIQPLSMQNWWMPHVWDPQGWKMPHSRAWGDGHSWN